MRKSTFFFVTMMLYSVISNAQVQQIKDWQAKYDSLEAFVVSGILVDRNPQSIIATSSNFNPMLWSNGIDSICTAAQFRDLYELFYHSSYDTTLYNFHPLDYDSIRLMEEYGYNPNLVSPSQTIMSQPDVDFVLGYMHLDYQQMNPAGFDSGYFYVDSVTQKYLVNSGWVNLHDTVFLDTSSMSRAPEDIIVINESIWLDTAVIEEHGFSWLLLSALSTVNKDYTCLENLSTPVKFTIPNSFFISNRLGLLQTFEADFDDGNGYIPIAPNLTYNITYSSFGKKNIKLRTYNLQNSFGGLPLSNYDSDTIVSRTEITVLECKLGMPDDILVNPDFNPCNVSDDGYGIGSIAAYVKYKLTGVQKLTKPVIILEGFETTDFVKGQPEYDQVSRWGFGFLNWLSFSSGYFGDIAPQLALFPTFVDSMRNEGYDVVIVDLHSNRSRIEKNAFALIHLIQYINNELQENNSEEQLVVIGPSMGALITRYALRKMELDGCCHNTRLYMSFDGPHQGANIPLSIQHFIYNLGHDLNPLGKGDDAKDAYYHVLNSPVARQMLVYHHSSSASNDFQHLYMRLDSMGYPQNCRIMAITSGSDMGHRLRESPITNTGSLLNGGDEFLSLKLRVVSPLMVPDLILPLVTLQSLGNLALGNPSHAGNFSLLDATAYVTPNSPNNTSSQVIFERGLNFNKNLIDFGLQLLTFGFGMAVIAKINAIHTIANINNLATMACLLCPAILGSQLTANLIASGAYSGVLVAKQLMNLSNNPSSNYDITPNHPTLPYDFAPGDYNNTPAKLEELGKGIVKAHFPFHSFMTTTSALGIDTTNLLVNVSNLLEINPNLSPFEDYYANRDINGEISRNNRHVNISLNLITWFMDKLRSTDNPFGMVGSPATLHQVDNYLNYGKPIGAMPPERFVKSMDILFNGEVYVNKYDVVGTLGHTFGTPNGYEHFSISTLGAECGTHITKINDGGKFIIGDNNYHHTTGESNSADVTYRKGSILEILPGGILIINDHSRLIIEEGATLIYHPGAIIELNGSNAILEIKGKVEVKDNAIFTFSSQIPNNYGHIIFNQRQWINGNEVPVTEYWEIGDNAEFVLEGAHAQGNVLMECKSNFRTSSGSLPKFSLLKLKNGAVQISENHNANLTADSVYMEGVLVDDNEQGAIKHNGIQFWGMNKQTAEIKTSVFKNGYHCVNAYQIGSQLPLRFDSCSFENNDTSLVVYNGAFEVFNCDFSTSELGIYTNNALKTSRIHHSIFELIEAVRIEGDESAELRIHESQFVSNITPNHKEGVAINSFYVDVSSTCSEFTLYKKAIIANDCMIDLSELAVNHFTENDTAILLMFADGINMLNGENDFENNGIDIIGYVKDLGLTPTININGILHVDCSHNNKFFVNNVVSNQPLLGVIGNANSNPTILPPFTSNSGLFVQMCENAQGYEPINPFEPAMNGVSHISINVDVLGNTYNFIDALLLVTNDVYGNEEYEAYLLDAISNLQSVIAQVDEEINASMSEDVKMAYIIALKMNMDLLRMAYDAHLIEVAGGDPGAPVNSYISNLSQYITTLVDAIEGYSQSADEERALFEIFRAHVYRLAENHQQGINLLMELNGNYTNQTQDRIDFWLCVMSWEQEALIGNINPDELQENIIGCYMMYNPHIAYKEDDRVVEKESVNLDGKISVYPNPTSDFLYFRSEGIAQLDDELIITITDTKGKQVYFNTEVASYVMRMDISNLAQGSYIVTVNTPTKRHNATFTVVR